MHIETTEQSKHPVNRNWLIHAVIVTWGLLCVATEHWFPGWSGAIGVGGVVPALIIYSLWKAWHELWFWITIAILATLQVPLMIYVQPLIIRYRFSFLFLFAFVDYLVVGVVMQCVALVFSKVYARNRA